MERAKSTIYALILVGASLVLSGCVVAKTAVKTTGAVVGGAAKATGAIVGGAVDVITPDGDDDTEEDE